MGIDLSTDMTEFFRERLAAALQRRAMQVEVETQVYLVNLLTHYAHATAEQALEKPLVERLAEALETPSAADRFRRFRELGDSALYACGFFSDHLDRRGISRDYVVGMGHRAYATAAELAARAFAAEARLGIYPRLADGFDAFARVIDDVRETTALRTPQDIIRLYERWRRTGSAVLAERLEQEGVFPQIVRARARGVLH